MNIIKYVLPLFLFLFKSTSSATPPPTLSQKYLTLRTQMEVLNTTENFDNEGGGIEDLDSGHYYERYNLNVSAFYTFTTDFATDLGFSFAQARSSDGNEERVNTQFTEFQAKILYQISERPFEWIPEMSVVIPFNRVDVDADDVLTGEGALQFSVGSWFIKDLGPFYIYLFGAYNYRDEGRSALLPWKLGTEIDFSGFYFGFEGGGFESLSEDEFTDNELERTRVTNRVNGGSLTFYAINPQELNVAGWIGVDFSKYLTGRLQYSQGINGTNAGVNRIFYAALEYRFDMTKNQPKEGNLIDRKSRKRLRDFHVDDEAYEEELFDKNFQHLNRRLKNREEKLLNEIQKNLE